MNPLPKFYVFLIERNLYYWSSECQSKLSLKGESEKFFRKALKIELIIIVITACSVATYTFYLHMQIYLATHHMGEG